MFRRYVMAVVFLIVAVHCQTSFATILTFTSRAAWQSAVGSFTTENFNSILTDTFFTDGSLAFPSLTLRSSGGAFSGAGVLIDVPPYNYNPGTGDVDGTARVNLGGLIPTSLVEIDFSSPVSAVGFDTVNYDIGDERAQALLGTMLIGNFPAARDQIGFIGVLDTLGSSITTIAIRGPTATTLDIYNAFDNVSFSRGLQTVPEPTSLALWAIGIGGVLMFRNRGIVGNASRV